jgi:uncharacterized protein YndB with AHSA1/START domain
MFETEWVLTAPIEQVFQVLEHPDGFSRWWPSVKRSWLIKEGDSMGLGRRAVYVTRGPLGFSVRSELITIEVDPPHSLRALIRGDVIGTGTLFLESRDDKTYVNLTWYVSTAKPWMNWVGRVARPFLVWAYHSVMREGCDALARHLGARLVSTRTKLVDRPTPALEAPHYGSSVETP